jgi:serine/threonine-protein kinase ATR
MLTVKNFAEAMQHGNKYIYQAMPRMLTIWLDMGEHPELLRLNSQKNKSK